MNKKSLFLMVIIFAFFQYTGIAQEQVKVDGVTATLKYGSMKASNGCMLENGNSYPVYVSYTIKFVKDQKVRHPEKDTSGTRQIVEKSGTIRLEPAGTPRVQGKPTARYWITAGEGSPVVFDETTVTIIVEKVK